VNTDKDLEELVNVYLPTTRTGPWSVFYPSFITALSYLIQQVEQKKAKMPATSWL